MYRDDLAYIHDAGHGDFARQAAPFLLEALGRSGAGRGLVVDLGCGSGIWAEALAKAGYPVLGIDISSAMIALARRRVPAAQFRRRSFFEAGLPSCVAVTALGECFSYLFDSANTKEGLRNLFRRVYHALHPGGLLIFDVATPGRAPGPGPRQDYRAGADWAVFSMAREDRQHRLLTRRITSFRRIGRRYRRDQEVHRLRLLAPAVVTAQLREVGFRARMLSGYGELRFAAGHAGFLARKPAVSPGAAPSRCFRGAPGR